MEFTSAQPILRAEQRSLAVFQMHKMIEIWRSLKTHLTLHLLRALGLEPGRRAYLSPEPIYVYLVGGGAYLKTTQIDSMQSMQFAFPELDEIVRGALLACENKDMREIRFELCF
jgi:hypothetical protein